MQTDEYQMSSADTKATMIENVWDYATKKGKQSVADGVKLDSWMAKGEQKGNMTKAVIDQTIETNQKEYIELKGIELDECFERGDIETANAIITDLRDNAKIGEDKIREQVSDYFRPLYYEAYGRDDDMAMDEIEDLLYDFDIGYNKQTFSSWNTQAKKKYYPEDEDEDEDIDLDMWLNR
jgi:hypothetical protein